MEEIAVLNMSRCSYARDLYNTLPFDFIILLSIVIVEAYTTNPSATNRCPIIDILSLISVKMLFNSLSTCRLLLLGIVIRPQASNSLRLYWQSIFKNVCKALLESILNHILQKNILELLLLENIYKY